MDDFMTKYEEKMAFLTMPIFVESRFPESEWTLNASLQPLEEWWDTYAIGYKAAADGIVEHMGEIPSWPDL